MSEYITIELDEGRRVFMRFISPTRVVVVSQTPTSASVEKNPDEPWYGSEFNFRGTSYRSITDWVDVQIKDVDGKPEYSFSLIEDDSGDGMVRATDWGKDPAPTHKAAKRKLVLESVIAYAQDHGDAFDAFRVDYVLESRRDLIARAESKLRKIRHLEWILSTAVQDLEGMTIHDLTLLLEPYSECIRSGDFDLIRDGRIDLPDISDAPQGTKYPNLR